MRLGVLGLVLLVWPVGVLHAESSVAARTRTFEIDPNNPVLQETIVSAYKRWTNINLPEEYASVMCGDCISTDEGQDEASMRQDPRRWLLDKNPAGPSLHVRPLDLPNTDLPPASYATELYIVLKGGYRINLEVRVVDIWKAQPDVAADSVVTITAPHSVLLSGRMREYLAQKEQEREDQKPQDDAEVLAENLMGINECKEVNWKVPHQNDKTVVRLHQLCASNGERNRAFWVIFSVENLDDARLYLQSAALVPANGMAVPSPPPASKTPPEEDWEQPPSRSATKKERLRVGRASRFTKTYLRHEEATSGIAVTTLDSKEPVPSEWKLLVTPHATDRGVVEVAGIRY